MKAEAAREVDQQAWELQKDMTPDVIVGGFSAFVPGSVRTACKDCGKYIWLAPETGAKAHLKFPSVPCVCYDCCCKRVDAARFPDL